MSKARVFVLSAPSGAGKTSLIRALLDSTEQVAVSLSHTTRLPRTGEHDGIDYHFVSAEVFESMVQQNEFLEYADIFDHRYGTARSEIERQQQQGKNVILEIDWQGAQSIRRTWPEVVSIFILPPSVDALRQRLQGRGTDDETVIERRLAQACADIRHCDEFSYSLVNDDFDAAVTQLRQLILNPDHYSDDDPRPCDERVIGMSD